MSVATINGIEVQVDDEGFLTNPDEWNEQLAEVLASRIGINLTEEHWKAVRFLREDFKQTGETPTIRKISAGTGLDIKTLFVLFPKKPAKKMAYIAGLPKPRGCV